MTKTGQSAQVPPHSKEAEQSVLGALMLDPRAWDQVADRLGSEDFYEPRHQVVFKAMGQLAAQQVPFDVLTVSEIIKSQDQLAAAGGDAYLFELTNNTPSVGNVIAYADIVRERSILRQLIAAGHDIAGTALNPEGKNIPDILDLAESQVFRIAEQRARGSGPVEMSTLLTRAVDHIEEMRGKGDGVTGVSTGFSDLDRMTSGLQAGDLVIVAGRPSMGKTVLGVNFAENAALSCKEKAVLLFSLEMSSESIAMRMMSSLGQIDQHKLRTGKLEDHDWAKMTSAINMLAETKIYVDDTPALTPTDMRARARRVARMKGGLQLIVVDYLQLMRVGGADNRTHEISEISRSLKALAKELGVPVIALSQLNRSLEQRQDKRPVMSDLRESGAIEQDADLIMFIYRDEVYNEDTPQKGVAEIIFAKQRNGPIGKERLTFMGRYTKFADYSGAAEPVSAELF